MKLISLVLALTVQGEVFEPASESSTTPEIAEKSAKGEDEENHLHDLMANPEDEADEAVKNLKPEALEGAKATTEMAGGVGAAVLGEKLKSLRYCPIPWHCWPHGPHGGIHGGPHGPHGWHQLASVQKTQHLRELSQDGTSHWLLLVRLLGSDAR